MDDFLKNLFKFTEASKQASNAQKGLNAISDIRESFNLDYQIPLKPKTPVKSINEQAPATTPTTPPQTPVTTVPGMSYSEFTGIGKPLYKPFKETITEVTQPKIQFYQPTPFRTTPLFEEPVVGAVAKFGLEKGAKPVGQVAKNLGEAINIGRRGEKLSSFKRVLKGVEGVGILTSIPNEIFIQPIWDSTKLAIKGIRTGKITQQDIDNAIYSFGGEKNTLSDALGLDEKTTDPVLFQAVRFIDFLPELIDIPGGKFDDATKFVKYAKEVEIQPGLFDEVVENGAKAFERQTGEVVSKETKDFVKKIKQNPKVLFQEAQKTATQLPEQNLIQEARKYKTFDEFIQSQGTPLYHGTNATFKNFELNQPRQALGNFKGVYFVDNVEEANDYGKIIKEAYINFKNPLIGNPYEEYAKAKNIDFIKNIFDIKKNDVEKWIKENNFDGIIRPAGTQYNIQGNEYIVLNKNAIKTKEQLVDIWKQAQKAEPSGLIKPTERALEGIPTADFGGAVPPSGKIPTFLPEKRGQIPSEIINLEPSTATLRTGRYGQNADVVAQGVKDNVTQIGEKMSPKVDLKKIDELAKAETTVISKETQSIYKKILDAVEKNPKFSEELAVLQQQQTAAIGDAVRQAGGRLTPDLIDALVRPKGFDRLIGQQLVSLKNAADGIFSAVTAKDINAIENSIGRTLTKDEIKTLEGINNLDDAAVFSDELRFSAKKINNTTEKILQLENELKKLDDFENQWQKAKDYITKNNIDVNDPEQFADVYRQFMPANIGDWFNLIQYNSMLSAPTTFLNNLTYVTTLLKNTAGYTVQGALQQLKSKIYKDYQPEYDLGSGIRYAGGYLKGTWKALGQPTKEWFGEVLGEMKNTKSLTDTPGQIVALQGNMWDKTKGLFQRFKNANKNFGEKIASMKLVTPEEFENIRLSKPGTALGYVEDFLKIPSNALEMADTLMGIIYKQGELAALTKGVRGKQAKATQRAMRDLFKGDLTEEGAGALSNIIGGLGDFAMKGRNYKLGSNDPGAKAIRAFANFTLPFIRVPTNWLKIGLEYTPAGLINLIGANDKTVPLAKVLTGLPISIFVASKYANGEITGGMPQDKKTRDYWTENGIKPFSIKIGDTWYDYTKFNPFMSVTMMTTVGAMEAFRQKDITQTQAERLLAMTMSVYEYWSQQSFVQNMGLLQNINSSDFSLEKLNKLGYNALSRAVPYQGLMRWYARLQDGSIKDPQTFQQTFEQNLPYFKQFVPNKLDSQGNPLKDEYNVYNSFPIFGKKSKQKEGAMEGLKELRNEQFINKSKTEIQNIIDEDVKRVAGGQIPSLDKGQAPTLIAGLNNIDPLNVYWLNPVEEKLETVDLSFTKYQPQNQKELKNYENRYNKLVQEIQYNPYISQQDMNNILNRLNVPENKRLSPTQEQKMQYYQLQAPEEKKPKVKATPEERQKNIQFSQLRGQLETMLPIQKLQAQGARLGRKGPRKPSKPKLKKVAMKKSKVGSKLAKEKGLRVTKLTAKKIPEPKINLKNTTRVV